jgi:hypothetical protein
MPIIQRNTISLSNLVFTTGNYINPSWIVSLSPAKVGSGTAQWNASQLQGYPIYTGVPSSGQVLSWTSSGWFPNTITASGSFISSGNISTTGTITSGFTTFDGTTSGYLSSTNYALVDSYPVSSGNCIKYITKAAYSGAIHVSEILIASDGNDAYMTEYGTVYSSGNLINFSVSYSSNNINLYAKPSYANTSIKLFKTIVN